MAGGNGARRTLHVSVVRMRAIKNKTRRPLVVPLPRDKKLHLGPGKTGQIAAEALDHAGVVKLVDAGEIEILDETQSALETGGSGKIGRGARGGTTATGVARRGGDR